MNRILTGDVLTGLAQLPEACVQPCISAAEATEILSECAWRLGPGSICSWRCDKGMKPDSHTGRNVKYWIPCGPATSGP